MWGKTPQEAWSGWKSRIYHLKVFESIAYAHLLDKTRTKLDDKNEKFIFIGYDLKSKAYKLYNPSTGKTIICRDVEFDEKSEWDFEIKENFNFLP